MTPLKDSAQLLITAKLLRCAIGNTGRKVYTMNLETLNEMIEYYEYYYNLCLDEGDDDEAEAIKQRLDELYEKRYNYAEI